MIITCCFAPIHSSTSTLDIIHLRHRNSHIFKVTCYENTLWSGIYLYRVFVSIKIGNPSPAKTPAG